MQRQERSRRVGRVRDRECEPGCDVQLCGVVNQQGKCETPKVGYARAGAARAAADHVRACRPTATSRWFLLLLAAYLVVCMSLPPTLSSSTSSSPAAAAWAGAAPAVAPPDDANGLLLLPRGCWVRVWGPGSRIGSSGMAGGGDWEAGEEEGAAAAAAGCRRCCCCWCWCRWVLGCWWVQRLWGWRGVRLLEAPWLLLLLLLLLCPEALPVVRRGSSMTQRTGTDAPAVGHGRAVLW